MSTFSIAGREKEALPDTLHPHSDKQKYYSEVGKVSLPFHVQPQFAKSSSGLEAK